jgi:hypothetical protein
VPASRTRRKSTRIIHSIGQEHRPLGKGKGQ